MKFVSNAGKDRVLDLIRPLLRHGHKLDVMSDSFSLFAFAELLNDLARLDENRIVFAPAVKAGNPAQIHPDHFGFL